MLRACRNAALVLLTGGAALFAFAPEDAKAAVAERNGAAAATPGGSCGAPCVVTFYRKGDGRGTIYVRTPADGERTCPLDTESVCRLSLHDNSQIFVAEPRPKAGSDFRGWELCLEQIGPNCRINATASDMMCVVFGPLNGPIEEGCPPLGAPSPPPPAPDKRSPETRIASGPKGTVKSRRATFRFRSNETARFQCRLDRQRWAACRSPKTYARLKPGLHVFRVRAIDRAGNVDPTPAVRKWRVRR